MVRRLYFLICSLYSLGLSPVHFLKSLQKNQVLLRLSEGIAQEIKGTGVTITTLCPGATRTNFAKRANIEDIRLFKYLLMEPEIVAKIGYKALMSGKPVVVTGIFNKISVFLLRFMPRTVACYIGMLLMQK